MLNPHLGELMGEKSNVVKFGKRFKLMLFKCTGEDVFYFVFQKPFGTKIELSELSEYCLKGNIIHEMCGYFF